ncbi:DUF86 domain-containing protein [Desulfopila sp. IMCC35006]|uniref:HepT-like ribonuclease domain-containing protein n=1 Tax=Desulfopila sp. IMCC35006 TaxID=2569542 RepID=UPI0010AC6992|nr:DUF86 domain-containing protein [Desulfopila sp. IMCC35006]TKB26466.1 DUF86 domain-containing protein [Desulfopila sp. IMCC35006]
MKSDLVYLCHIRDSITKIESYAAVGKETFITVSHWHDAIIRNLEIIGEVTKRLSQSLKEQYPNIPWRNIAGLRDVLIHDYMGIDLESVWNVVENDLPPLKEQLRIILTDLP